MARYVPILYKNKQYQSILSMVFKKVSRHAPSLVNALSPSDFVFRAQKKKYMAGFYQSVQMWSL